MRKKTEVQPPFLPDLTSEALRIGSQTALNRSINSPASSSNGTDDIHRFHLSSTNNPLIRLLKSSTENNHLQDAGLTTWADDPSIRSILGIQGLLVVDVAQILLEYAHQVFGIHFKSLFQLSEHLVTNRYVNSRSKHAFALIAHAANSPVVSAYSPPPTALADVIHRSEFLFVFNLNFIDDT